MVSEWGAEWWPMDGRVQFLHSLTLSDCPRDPDDGSLIQRGHNPSWSRRNEKTNTHDPNRRLSKRFSSHNQQHSLFQVRLNKWNKNCFKQRKHESNCLIRDWNSLKLNGSFAQLHARTRQKTRFNTHLNNLVHINEHSDATSCNSYVCHGSKLDFLSWLITRSRRSSSASRCSSSLSQLTPRATRHNPKMAAPVANVKIKVFTILITNF